jgi:hypothetical protein
VDLADPLGTHPEADDEEQAADRYALELLTGMEEPRAEASTQSFTAHQLAEALLAAGEQIRIEPGTLALCFGYTTGDWAKANAALKKIYSKPIPVWQEINHIAESQLQWNKIPNDASCFLAAVMGGISGGDKGSRR